MKNEISVAVQFLVRVIERSNPNDVFPKEQIEAFKERLTEVLKDRFENHWFPDKPTRGQGYRCIRLNESDKRDKVIDKAASYCGIVYEHLRLPTELTIWVDPTEVCCRY